MKNNSFTFLVIPLIVIITSLIARYIRKRNYRPKYEDGVQKPGKLEGFILNILISIDALLAVMLILGIIMKESEMAIVSGGLAFFILAIIMFLKQAYRASYQENTECFILKSRNKEYQVYYENIIDWQPAFNEIAILDKTRSDEKYIKINIKIFKPEIMLRKIADMTFAGKLYSLDHNYFEDPSRKTEIVSYLVKNDYGYLIKDYIEKTENNYPT